MTEIKPISEVYNIDCLEYMKTLPDKHFDLCIADPPYRDAKDNQPQYEMRNVGFSQFLGNNPNKEMLNEIFRVSKNTIIWGANNFDYPFKGFIAWDKQVRGADRYSQVEIASLSEGLSTVSKYVSISCLDKNGKIHPTQKPIALYAWILDNYTKEGDKIFDPFLGSGSSRIAAYKKGFDFYACELDKDYYEAQEERFRRECLGEYKRKDGRMIKQLSLF